MAFIMMNAANMAYNKAIKKTRDEDYLKQNFPAWMMIFAQNLPEKVKTNHEAIVEDESHRRARVLSGSDHPYLRLGWFVYSKITSQMWFEAFVMVNILLVGLFTGLDLENRGRNAAISQAVRAVSSITSAVFTVEVGLKLIIEGFQPLNYFRDKENGSFNTFDAVIVLAGYVFIGFEGGSAIGALRMLRLVRLLTFIKGVPQLRAIMAGLINGVNSVTYIVMLLALLIYLFAIMGTLIFGANDPARFGSVMLSMLSLFQVSTLASWTSIAYTSWYGCGQYLGDPYAAALNNPDLLVSRVETWVGDLQGYKCDVSTPKPIQTFFFFSCYIIITAWVVLSLFIGVMSMGMFEAFQEMKEKIKEQRYRDQLEKNNNDGGDDDDEDDFGDDDDDNETMGKLDKNGKPVEKSANEKKEEKKKKALRLKRKKKKEAAKEKAEKQKMKQDKPVSLEQGASLRELIDAALSNELPVFVPSSRFEAVVCHLQEKALTIRDSDYFEQVIVLTILLVGVVIGVDTDETMHCERLLLRIHDGRDDDKIEARSWCGKGITLSFVVGIISQLIFTVEAMIKMAAEGLYPMQYFTDKKNGSWNCLDLFVVVTGYVEMSPLSFIFEAFPVVVLRLLRLLRVFRLAKALPRLRSIVDALMSGMSSVGWIVALVCIFNYILGCMCMLFLQANDPVHFGTLGRAMFTVLRIETLDSWDQILYISMFGCAEYPAGYGLLNEEHPVSQCNHSFGLGWVGAFLFFFIVIMGAYVLPTVLVGIVSISFDEASRRNEALQEMEDKMALQAKAAYDQDPVFFAPARIVAIRDVFDAMDADGELSLDVNEMAPFYQYSFDILFGVDLTSNATEALFHLMDMDGDTELGFAEFLLFVMVIKKIELMCIQDLNFASRTFPPGEVKRTANTGLSREDAWKASVAKMDKEALAEAWVKVIHFLDSQPKVLGSFENPKTLRAGQASFDELGVGGTKIRALFENFDSDKDGKLDTEEVAIGLVSLGVLVNKRQVKMFAREIDDNKDGFIDIDEFYDQVIAQRKRLNDTQRQTERAEAAALLGLEVITEEVHAGHDEEGNAVTEPVSFLSQASLNGGGTAVIAPLFESGDGSGGRSFGNGAGFAPIVNDASAMQHMMDQPLGDVVGWCSRLVASRFMQEVRAKHGLDNQSTGAGTPPPPPDKATQAFARLVADRITGEFHWFDHPDGPLGGNGSLEAGSGSLQPGGLQSGQGSLGAAAGGGNDVSRLAQRTMDIMAGAGVVVKARPQQQQQQPSRRRSSSSSSPPGVRRPATPPPRGEKGARAFFGVEGGQAALPSSSYSSSSPNMALPSESSSSPGHRYENEPSPRLAATQHQQQQQQRNSPSPSSRLHNRNPLVTASQQHQQLHHHERGHPTQRQQQEQHWQKEKKQQLAMFEQREQRALGEGGHGNNGQRRIADSMERPPPALRVGAGHGNGHGNERPPRPATRLQNNQAHGSGAPAGEERKWSDF